jgi:DNA-directed RNA polymerase alpha subunit
LSQAGIGSLEDLRKASREGLLALRGIGAVALDCLEELLGRKIPSRAEYWLSRGLATGVANALVREGIHTLDDLGKLTREQLLSFRGIGYFAFRACERLLGRRLPLKPY